MSQPPAQQPQPPQQPAQQPQVQQLPPQQPPPQPPAQQPQMQQPPPPPPPTPQPQVQQSPPQQLPQQPQVLQPPPQQPPTQQPPPPAQQPQVQQSPPQQLPQQPQVLQPPPQQPPTHQPPPPAQQPQLQQPSPQQLPQQPPQPAQQPQVQQSPPQQQPPSGPQQTPLPVQSPLSQSPPDSNQPIMSLVKASSREQYLKDGVPLYEASIKCNWKAAKAILDKKEELVRYSITENGETPLHVAASAKGDSKRVEHFVKKLVDLMEVKDLELENKNCNTALYLAAVTGNAETVKIMVKKNRRLLTIAGANRKMMPLYAAALFGNEDVVEYIYEESSVLSKEDGWSPESRGWLIERLVENNMFDVALKVVKNFPLSDDTTKNVLKLLAGKPEVFHDETKSLAIKSVFTHICFKSAPQKKSKALPLLTFIWSNIVTKPTKDIDTILRGPPDSILAKQDSNEVAGWAVKVMQLQKVIHEYVENMKLKTDRITSSGTPITSSGPSITPSGPSITSSGLPKSLKLQDLISQSLVGMHVATQQIIKESSDSTMQVNMPASNKKHLALELQKLISKHIANLHDETEKKIKSIQLEDQLVSELQNVISTRITKLVHETTKVTKSEKYSNRVVFIAAEMGNTNFLVELIRGYPDLIWKVNDNNQSIFHIAVKHRHEGIYNLLYEIGAMKDLITPLRDTKENNMLHLVGKIAKKKRLEDASGAALQMQQELLWFHEVQKMVPVSYKDRPNEDGLTPHELFTIEHKELVKQGEKWMKGTASQCMVVAALIATIVFAATFTVPGGYDQETGIPTFRSKATFVVFVVADAISLISSSASILMFLSILTSRYAEQDFLKSLPRQLLYGLATLLISIATMMIAFGFSFFPLYHKGLLWIPILICALVVLPTLLYVWLQFRLFLDLISSTFHSRYLFKPRKRVLYYEKNPKV